MGRTEYDPVRKQAVKKRTITSALMIFIAVPALLMLSTFLGNGQHYMIISLAVVICCMLPFFLVFEKRKPKAREIVLVAMMSAITVAAHMFFHVTVPIQIGTAMVIIAGIAMGPEAGFRVGTLSRFVCNFYMGQGPWTPWQMFCWGLLGFLAGLAFNKIEMGQKPEKIRSRDFTVVMGPVLCVAAFEVLAYVICLLTGWSLLKEASWLVYACGVLGLLAGVLLQRKRLPVDNITITVFTFFSTVILYGGIINMQSFFNTAGIPGSGGLSWETLRILYVSGLPYDISHGLAAALCIFLIGNPMIRKIERIKIKYGIYK